MGEDRRQACIDLAAALRWAAKLGLNEGIDNHFTLDISGAGEERYLAHPFGLHWSEITPDDLIVVDGEGNTLEGEGEIERTAFCIHVPIHRAAPHAKCVLHTHMPYATALSSCQSGHLEMVSQTAVRFANRIAYDNHYSGLALGFEEGERLAKCLGSATVLFMANHGVTVTGPTVGMAFDDLYFVERAAMVQVLAESTGRPMKHLPPEVVRDTVQQMAADVALYRSAHFEALKRLLAREAPEFKP